MEEELDLSSLEPEDIDDDVLGVDFNIISIIRRHLEITTTLAAVTMLCIVAHALSILEMYWSDSSSDCLGAIDGTHVRVKVPRSDAPRFRGRKDWPTQNVFAACDFDMKFTYVLAGWEGTASDSRILKNALDRDDPLVIPQGKYYLGDAGFMLKSTVLTPYRGVRYHLKEYTRRGPQNARELFNHQHSSLRNVIERTFGVLKKRFPIIASGIEPHYDLETMTEIILACCILHNFLPSVDHDDSLLDEVDNEFNEREEHNVSSSQVREEDHRMGSSIRDAIADHMWRDYQNS
ncbi:protein ALP1-like [Vigna radiata var. radiata]|uniref:Protein ALP1-like n=1 Tax=Vigna radiata var. radiata TaxID=3916 RepID=A0A1S3TG42_VIGRR|nr:protein ALP1-like [Vigna radiata var. radiata]